MELSQLSRSPAAEVARAGMFLADAGGDDYHEAARSGDSASHLAARSNPEGLAALTPRHGGGRRPTYGPQDTGRIVAEAARSFGPRLQAAIAYLGGVDRPGKRAIRRLLADLYGIPISPGSISDLEARTSQACDRSTTRPWRLCGASTPKRTRRAGSKAP